MRKRQVMQMKNKFWKWAKNSSGENVLRLDGIIAQESWFDDEISPKQFRNELNACTGDIEIYINSPGGDVFAASQIYTMLMEYKGNVTVKIDGVAASAASVIAMAGTTVAMSPTSNLMIHNPWTAAIGNEEKMKNAVEFLSEIKESIINAYELKTSLPREKISELMTAETWMNAKKALELGFCDKILFTDEEEVDTDTTTAMLYSPLTVYNSICKKISAKKSNGGKSSTAPKNNGQGSGTTIDKIDAKNFYKRLDLILH